MLRSTTILGPSAGQPFHMHTFRANRESLSGTPLLSELAIVSCSTATRSTQHPRTAKTVSAAHWILGFSWSPSCFPATDRHTLGNGTSTLQTLFLMAWHVVSHF